MKIKMNNKMRFNFSKFFLWGTIGGLVISQAAMGYVVYRECYINAKRDRTLRQALYKTLDITEILSEWVRDVNEKTWEIDLNVQSQQVFCESFRQAVLSSLSKELKDKILSKEIKLVVEGTKAKNLPNKIKEYKEYLDNKKASEKERKRTKPPELTQKEAKTLR